MDEQRRKFLVGAGLAGTAVASALAPNVPTAAEAQAAPQAPTAKSEPEGYLTLTSAEAAFFSAAVDIIVPADELSPSGTECGVVTFIDRQLAGRGAAAQSSIAAVRSARPGPSTAISCR